MENITETILYEEHNDDTTDALLEQYEDGRSKRLDDVISTQAVICVLTAAALFILNLFYPETAGRLYEQLKHCMNDTSNILPDPVEYIVSYLQKK